MYVRFCRSHVISIRSGPPALFRKQTMLGLYTKVGGPPYAEVAVGAGLQGFIKAASLQQAAQMQEQVAALHVRVAHQKRCCVQLRIGK